MLGTSVGAGTIAATFGLIALLGYLVGSVNFAVIISRLMYRKDVRTLGSGNAGMTNVLRNFGKTGAALTLLGDIGKGVLTVFLGHWVFAMLVPGADTLYGAYIAGICTILGHMFPLYFQFKGGKGVATSCGVILALQPILAPILFLFFIILVLTSKMVSFGSVIGISAYPVVTLVWALYYNRLPVFSTTCSAIIAALVVWMHRANIKRILAGTEYKFGQKKKEETRKEI